MDSKGGWAYCIGHSHSHVVSVTDGGVMILLVVL